MPQDAFEMGPVYRSMARRPTEEPGGSTLVEVVVSWGDSSPLAVAHLRAGERFELTSRGCAHTSTHCFVHPAIDGVAHALVVRRGPGCAVTLPDGAVATVARLATLATATGAFELRPGERASIEHGAVRYTVRHVAVPARLPRRRGDRLFGAATALALAATVAAGRWVADSKHPDEWFMRDGDGGGHLAADVFPTSARAYAPTHAEGGVGVEGGTGRRAIGDEGAAGARHGARASRRWATPPRRGPSRARSEAHQPGEAARSVQDRGIFAALGDGGMTPWVAALGGDAADRAATGGMYGTSTGEAHGYEGLGLLGTGWGGGFAGDGLIGLGRLRTRGHGTDDGSGQGIGSGSFCGCGGSAFSHRATGTSAFGVRGSAGPTVCGVSWAEWQRGARCPDGSTSATLDASTIRRVVRQNLGQVRHCYEATLARSPSAAGRVVARWVIGGDGAVLAATLGDNDTGDAGLGACVVDAVRRWQFPAPGGPVSVSYPFDLSVIAP